MTVNYIILSSLLSDVRSGFASGDDLEDGVFQIRMNNITRSGVIDYTKKRRVHIKSKKPSELLIQKGDVLFNATNSPELVGKSALVKEVNEPTTFSNHFIRLRPNCELLDSGFLAKWLNYIFLKGTFKGLCKQWVNQATVSRESLLALKIPLPPLAQQRRIAAILDKVDELRQKRQQSVEKLDQLLQVTFIEMFGDPVSNPKGWDLKPVGEISESKLGKMLDKKKQSSEKDQHKYLRNANVQWFRFDLSDVFEMEFNEKDRKNCELKFGDILVCEGGEPGRAAIWKNDLENCFFQKALHRVRLDMTQILPEYFVWLFWFYSKNGGFDDHITVATIAHLTGIKMKAMQIPIPPLSMQEEFQQKEFLDKLMPF